MKTYQHALIVLGLFAASAVVVADGHAKIQLATPHDYYSPLEAFGDVCIKSADHGEMLRKVRASGWEALKGDQIPAVVQGKGAVRWAEVRRGQIAGQPVMLAVGPFSGTSFCRIYFRPVEPAAMQEQLRYVHVLGSPLGLPDSNDKMNYPEGWSFVGWHRSTGDQWRAVHYEFDADGQGPNAAWQAIEITRQT